MFSLHLFFFFCKVESSYLMKMSGFLQKLKLFNWCNKCTGFADMSFKRGKFRFFFCATLFLVRECSDLKDVKNQDMFLRLPVLNCWMISLLVSL